jgi:hypothetical protein
MGKPRGEGETLEVAIRSLSEAVRELTAEVRLLREERRTGGAPVASPALTAPIAAHSGQVATEVPTAAAEGQAGVVGEAESIIRRAFRAALADDDEQGFGEFLALLHPSRKDSERRLRTLRGRDWEALKRNLHTYLDDPADAGSFAVVRTQPAEPAEGESEIKVFIRSSSRRPVPVTLRRGDGAGGELRLTDSAL